VLHNAGSIVYRILLRKKKGSHWRQRFDILLQGGPWIWLALHGFDPDLLDSRQRGGEEREGAGMTADLPLP